MHDDRQHRRDFYDKRFGEASRRALERKVRIEIERRATTGIVEVVLTILTIEDQRRS